MIQVKALKSKDMKVLLELEKEHDFRISTMIKDDEDDEQDYGFGIFDDDILIGHCSLGNADCEEEMMSYPGATCDSLLLSDVYIKKQYRHKGLGTKLCIDAIHIKNSHKKEHVFATVINDDVIPFYLKMGFKIVDDEIGLIVLEKEDK